MRARAWCWSRWSLAGVALVTATASLCPPAAVRAQTVALGPGTDSYRLAAVPEPPVPPRPPTQSDLLGFPETPRPADELTVEGAEVETDGANAPENESPVWGDSRYGQDAVDDLGPDGTVRVPPGLTVPTYPVVINAPVEALIDHFVAKDRER